MSKLQTSQQSCEVSKTLKTEKLKLAPVDLMICTTLFLHVVSNRFFISILTDCVCIETTCPKLPTPKHLLHFWMAEKDLLCGYAFCYLHYSGWRECGHALHEEMHVILVGTYLDEVYLVPLAYSNAYLGQCSLDFFRKHLPSVLGRAYKVIQQQRLVVAFKDMFTHTTILPRSRASRNLFD
jgi:hypothetical protein